VGVHRATGRRAIDPDSHPRAGSAGQGRATTERDPDYAVTLGGLVAYAVVVGAVIALINID
jgi:hypothetical protein